jgi:hypothetical protein
MAREQHCRYVPDSGRPPARLQFASGTPGLCDPKAQSAQADTRPILSMPISITRNRRLTLKYIGEIDARLSLYIKCLEATQIRPTNQGVGSSNLSGRAK